MKTSNINNKRQIKESLIALQELTDIIGNAAKEKGITEKDLLKDLEQVREEMWSERRS